MIRAQEEQKRDRQIKQAQANVKKALDDYNNDRFANTSKVIRSKKLTEAKAELLKLQGLSEDSHPSPRRPDQQRPDHPSPRRPDQLSPIPVPPPLTRQPGPVARSAAPTVSAPKVMFKTNGRRAPVYRNDPDELVVDDGEEY